MVTSIDGPKCPLIENFYNLVKLMNLHCTISFNRVSRILEIVYWGKNLGCDEIVYRGFRNSQMASQL
jgi:hypothetical protein